MVSPKNIIMIEDKELEILQEYIYLGPMITLKKIHEDSIKQHIMFVWKTFSENIKSMHLVNMFKG